MPAPTCLNMLPAPRPSLGLMGLILIVSALTSNRAPAVQGSASVAFAPSLPTTLLESGAGIELVVELSVVQAGPVTVPFELTGTAEHGFDFTTGSVSPLVIPAGMDRVILHLAGIVDGVAEGDESITVTLLVPTGADLGAPSTHGVTLLDGDPVPSLSFAEPSSRVLETAGQVLVRVELSGASATGVQFSGTVGGTAAPGVDYNIGPGPYTILAGSLFVDVPVDLLDDSVVEGTEVLLLYLDPAMVSGAVLGPVAVHRMRIRDDESTQHSASAFGLQVAPSSAILTQTRVGEVSTPTTLVLTNGSYQTRTILGFEWIGRRPEQFDGSFQAGPGPHVLAPGQSTELSVWLSPNASGFHDAALIIIGDWVGEPTIQIPISGSALGILGQDIALHAGTNPLVTVAGLEFAPEWGGDGAGSLSFHRNRVTGSDDDGLYQALRQGPQLAYSLPLPNGAYDLLFHYAEPEHTLTGQRSFDISVEGEVLLAGWDVIGAAGAPHTAVTTPALRAWVQDGTLDIVLQASAGQALFQGLEVRAAAVLELTPSDLLDFVTVEQGQSSELLLAVENTGLLPGHVTSLVMEVALGSSSDFEVEFGGTPHSGGNGYVVHPVDVWIQPGETLAVPVRFTPSEHAHHHFDLSFSGPFASALVEVQGTGGADSSWGFLHPTIIRSPPIVVDYDGDGFETVSLDGSLSHTHELGRILAGFEWDLNGSSFSSQAETSVSLPLGPVDIALTVTDDGLVPFSATVHEPFVVHPVDQVPAVLALYYVAAQGDPSALLDAPPARADFIARIAPLRIVEMQGAFGTSPFTQDVMVELRCSFQVPLTAQYHFVPSGASGSRVLVNGVLHGAAETLPPGQHSLVARFALQSLADVPAVITTLIDGVPQPDFAAGVVHDEGGVVPVIHDMPTLGIDSGGTMILIEGFGFYPRAQMVLHWGSQTYTHSALASWSSDRILFETPPGSGVVQVWVETPAGSSNLLDYEYSPTGPVPITWTELTNHELWVFQPTCLAFGPDGRLYVGRLDGQISAFELNTDWSLSAAATYPGVSGLSNPHILGIAFDPYDSVAGGPVRVYVAHGHHYANGGGSFSGPSTYSGQVSAFEGPLFDGLDVILSGLPVSNHDHSVNGLEFDNDGNLLIAVGGNTNAGVKWPLIGDVPESPLSAAVIRAWVKRPGFDGQVLYADRITGAPSVNQVDGEEVIVVGGDVSVVASGLRNPYDLVLTTRGLLYATDNGPNEGYGPESTGANTSGGQPHPYDLDELNLLEEGSYYGHPNRARGHADPRQNVYHFTGAPALPGVYERPLAVVDSSTDGVIEYRSAAFGGQLRGDLILQKWNEAPLRLKLDETGRFSQGVTALNTGVSGLDVVAGPGGVLITADFSSNRVRFIVPSSGLTGPLALFDVQPWRAPETGGGSFTLGGRNFGDITNTTVAFGGVVASLLTVEPTRITGILPPVPNGASASLVDISVQVGSAQTVLLEAFRWLPTIPGFSRGPWSTGISLPDSLGEVAAGLLGDQIILVGEGSPKTYSLNVLTGEWDDSLSQRPFAGHHHAAEVVDGRLFLFGSVGSFWGKVQIYDPIADTWTVGADMPWAAGSCSSALIDGMVYVCGGIVGSSTVGTMGLYDPTQDLWNPAGPLPPMPTPVNHAASATDGTYLWVFGGRGGGNWPQPGFDNVQRFDPATGIWIDSAQPAAALNPMPMGRGGTGGAVWHGERFFVIGGESSGGLVFDDVQVYTPATDRWNLDSPLPTARHGIDPVLVGNRIWVLGGGVIAGFSSSPLNEVLQR